MQYFSIPAEEESYDSNQKKTILDTQNVFSQLLSKNKEIALTTLASNIVSSFNKDIKELIDCPKPRSNEPHIILKLRCSLAFYRKYSINKKEIGLLQIDAMNPDDNEYEEGNEESTDEMLAEVIQTHVQKTIQFKEKLKSSFEDFEGLTPELVEEIYYQYCEQKTQKLKETKHNYNRINTIFKSLIGDNERDFMYLIFSDFLLIFTGILKYYTRFNSHITFTDFQTHFLLHIWGDENEYSKLAETMGYELMIRPFAIQYEMAKNWVKQQSFSEVKNNNVQYESNQLNDLNTQFLSGNNNCKGKISLLYSELNFDNRFHLSPYTTYTEETKGKFQRYEPDDTYHDCSLQNNSDNCNEEEEEKQNNYSCGKCSIFRNTDKLRIIYDALDNLLKINMLKKTKVLSEIFVMRNYEDYKASLGLMPIVFGSSNIFSDSRQMAFIYTIRNYYNEIMSYYFLWLTNFLKWLIVPSLFGIVIFIVFTFTKKNGQLEGKLTYSDAYKIIFGALTMVWASLLLHQWKQQEELFNYAWGTENFKHNEPDREAFTPDINEELMFGKTFPYVYQRRKYLKYFISYLILIIMIFGTCGLIILSFWVKTKLGGDSLYISMGVASVNAIQIKIMNFIYCFISEKLNNWENHQKEHQRINSNNVKMILFDFINNYFACFFIACKNYLAFLNVDSNCYGYSGNANSKCIEELEIQLYTTLAIFAGFNFLELGLPFGMQAYRFYKFCKAKEENYNVKISPEDITRFGVEFQELSDDYNDVSSEYSEMLILFGYVCLFGASAPLVPFIVFALVYIEKYVDSFKLFFLVKVSILDGSTGIEMYKKIMQGFIWIGLFTTAAIICFTDKDLETGGQTLANSFIILVVVLFLLCFVSKINILPKCKS